MTTLRIIQDELQPYFYFTIEGVAELIGATISCTMLDSSDVAIIDDNAAGCFITDTVARQAEYRWQSGDTDIAGTFRIYFHIIPLIGDVFDTEIYPIEIIASGEDELVTVSDVEKQIRFDLSDTSEHIVQLIQAVREQCESITRRSLKPKSETLTLNYFPSGRVPLEIANPPLRSIDAIAYIDTDGVSQTLDPLLYRIVFNTQNPIQPSYIIPAYGEVWPTALSDVAVVTIDFTSGYGTVLNSESVYETIELPKAIKQWMLINIANLIENTETVMVGNANRLSVIEIPSIGDGLIADHRVSKW